MTPLSLILAIFWASNIHAFDHCLLNLDACSCAASTGCGWTGQICESGASTSCRDCPTQASCAPACDSASTACDCSAVHGCGWNSFRSKCVTGGSVTCNDCPTMASCSTGIEAPTYMPTASAVCIDRLQSNGNIWFDYYGNACSDYNSATCLFASSQGSLLSRDGYTPDVACCVCGGGWMWADVCSDFGCTCNGATDYYGIIEYTQSDGRPTDYGCAPDDVIVWWDENCTGGQLNTPSTPQYAGCTRSSVATEKSFFSEQLSQLNISLDNVIKLFAFIGFATISYWIWSMLSCTTRSKTWTEIKTVEAEI